MPLNLEDIETLFARRAGAVRPRLPDDLAKEPDGPTPPLSHFLARAQRCMLK